MAENKAFPHEVIREGDEVILNINCEKFSRLPSLENDPLTMANTVDILTESPNVTKIVFAQKRSYEYDYNQTMLLVEIAKVYSSIIKDKDAYGYAALASQPECSRFAAAWYATLRHLSADLLKSDPIGCYVELKREYREEKIRQEHSDAVYQKCGMRYLGILSRIIDLLDATKLIQLIKPYLAGYRLGDRSPYMRVFIPSIKPDFMFTKLMAEYPIEGEEVDNYLAEENEITVFELPNTIQYLYHVMPPEFKLSEDEYELLDTAREIMAEHKPQRSEFVDPQRMRQVFISIGKDLIEELLEQRKQKMSPKKIEVLANILVRYTVGFGIIEVLLSDDKVQDITINSPLGEIPIFIVHQDYGECYTNIIPTRTESESWASKLRMISGRPLDEANPILDTELELPNARARVAVIAPPLNPSGIAYAFRRHRDKPWTLPLFIANRMINPLASGIISFIIDGNRTMLVAGTRSAGKTSLMGGVLTEIMRKYRVITIEDTLELPVSALRNLGYNIQPMKVGAALTKGTAEVPAEEGIRTTLRMGDSALIIGEVRSTEARALYEAM